MIFILSAQRINESLKSDFGNLPISFLPIANRRLYKFQIDNIRKKFPLRRILITLPNDFDVLESETNWLKEKNIEIQKLKGVISFGHEISLLIQSFPVTFNNSIFYIGSSLTSYVPKSDDEMGLYETDLEPFLPIESYGLKKDTVWAGVFSISNISLFSECLTKESCDLFRAVKSYSFYQKMKYSFIHSYYSVSSARCYFQARSSFTTERAFNFLRIDNLVLKKFSKNQKKIRGEANWFKNAPYTIRKYLPQYLGDGIEDNQYYYSLEYLAAVPLNECFVFGQQTVVFWERIFNMLSFFLHEARILALQSGNAETNSQYLFIDKTYERLSAFIEQSGFNADMELEYNGKKIPSLKKIVDEVSSFFLTIEDISSFIHGDFCLSNILYDSRLHTIKLIDPRGVSDSSQEMQYGSQLYDLAKLAHSVIGLYDYIIAESYTLEVVENKFYFNICGIEQVEEIQCLFRKLNLIPQIPMASIEKILPLLFISMLPLHSDSYIRQQALLANALRLYVISYLNDH